ncbi:AraC family transcriptional regulator [Oxalobacteraceae bacterium OTU3CINTB1]|nr:AraC family transcriptional regulator [Oxalobacteraceae bacterium OTU3CINTB1]
MPAKPHLPDAEADVPPHVIRQVLQLLASRGHSVERLCKGLGFTPENLRDAGFRVSYRQTSMLVRRAMQRWGDAAMGIATGARQTVVCFGLPGLGMLTCPTLGEALLYLIKYQRAAGTLVINELAVIDERNFMIEAATRFHDPELEPFFIEEIFVSGVEVARAMVGSHVRPSRLELRYPRPAYASAYSEYFRCPVVFNAPLNRLICDMSWYHCPLPTHDSFMQESLQAQIDQLLSIGQPRNDLVESIMNVLRASVDEMPGLAQTGAALNMSERTLRRRLAELDTSYQRLVDQVRYECALDLLRRSAMPLVDIAMATGFTDARNFRRAFKRWSGILPNQIRQGVPAPRLLIPERAD